MEVAGYGRVVEVYIGEVERAGGRGDVEEAAAIFPEPWVCGSGSARLRKGLRGWWDEGGNPRRNETPRVGGERRGAATEEEHGGGVGKSARDWGLIG